MNHKNRSIFVLIAFALAAGAFLFWNNSKPVMPEPQIKPLTLEEAKTIEIDTSGWKSFRSKDGVLELRYPERIEDQMVWEISNIGTPAYMGSPSTTHHVGAAGKYVPHVLAVRIPESEVEPELNFNVRLYDESADLDSLLNAEKQNADRTSVTSPVVIGGEKYIVTEYEKWDDGQSVKSYFYKLADGRILHVYAQAWSSNTVEYGLHWELADLTMKKIIASIRVH